MTKNVLTTPFSAPALPHTMRRNKKKWAHERKCYLFCKYWVLLLLLLFRYKLFLVHSQHQDHVREPPGWPDCLNTALDLQNCYAMWPKRNFRATNYCSNKFCKFLWLNQACVLCTPIFKLEQHFFHFPPVFELLHQ